MFHIYLKKLSESLLYIGWVDKKQRNSEINMLQDYAATIQ